jgi:DNA-binding helix-hairpin-helix protein with protein kinase domain
VTPGRSTPTSTEPAPGARLVLTRRLPYVPEQLILGRRLKSGGEGTVFATHDDKFAVKFYWNADPAKIDRIDKVMTIGETLGDDARFFVWPVGIIGSVNGTPRAGYVMRLIPASSVPLIDLVMTPSVAIERFRSGTNWSHLLRIAREIALCVRVLHGKGCAHTDLHYKNFHADPATCQAVLLDLDGLVVEGSALKDAQVAGVLGFRAPEVERGKANPSVRTDRHSIAVLVFQTLLLRNPLQPLVCYDADDRKDEQLGWGEHAVFSEYKGDPRNCPPNLGKPLLKGGALSYTMLGPELQDLFDRAFVKHLSDPKNRPLAQEWEGALASTLDHLTPCGACQQPFPYPYWVQPRTARRCPFCGTRVREPYPAVIELLDPRAKGVFQPSRRIVVSHNDSIYRDAVESGRVPPISRAGMAATGHVRWHQGVQLLTLVNDDNQPWQALPPGGRPPAVVGPGQAVPLQVGLHLKFGAGNRVARVIE